MREIDIEEASGTLPRLVDEIEPGDELLLTRQGKAVARIIPVPHRQVIRLGLFNGKYEIPEDFDAPLPDEVIASFEGR